MDNQRISTPQAGTPADIVRWLGAVQAQDFAGAKWGVGLRLLGMKDEQVEQAFTKGLILRTHLMRPTWHFVTPEDIRWLLALTADRVRAAMRSVHFRLGIDDDLVRRSNRSFEKALQDGQPLTREELVQVLKKDGIDPGSGQRLGNILMRAELDGVICSGPRRGKQFTYLLLDERAPAGRVLDRQYALAELAGRFFLSRGPATLPDFARWSGLTLTEARSGLQAVKDKLLEERWEGQSYWLPASSSPAREGGRRTYWMSVYDEYLSGYQDRRAMLAPAFLEPLRGIGNGLVNILVLDGQVVGAWRRVERKSELQVELVPFRLLAEGELAALQEAGKRYGAFFGKEVVIG